MNAILTDRELCDLIERLEAASAALGDTFQFEARLAEFHDLADSAVSAMTAATQYLLELREAQHSN
jgi:hypothetical protein